MGRESDDPLFCECPFATGITCSRAFASITNSYNDLWRPAGQPNRARRRTRGVGSASSPRSKRNARIARGHAAGRFSCSANVLEKAIQPVIAAQRQYPNTFNDSLARHCGCAPLAPWQALGDEVTRSATAISLAQGHCQHDLYSEVVRVNGHVPKTGIPIIHTEFVHEAGGLHLAIMHGIRESCRGRLASVGNAGAPANTAAASITGTQTKFA